ncbi:hypothetical protein KDK82_6154 [Delftia sp. K82]|jgi:hypothetical protein|uniref:HEPN domain-containing protein n=1 Tax=Delftia TaxID=80865 RepID=UPI000B496355|nr:HEPN domain-containing protein [Delftia sp. K82]OWG12436.1 hypothetical protein KDK82_6154 [Delftia sp. K82]
MQNNISINKAAVSQALRAPLEAYYKDVSATGYDGTTERPGRWDEDEALFKALYKSKYVAQHLDWLYVLDLIFSVLDSNQPLKATDFAEKLEELVIATARQRDYLAIFPLSFRPMFSSFLPGKGKSLIKKKVIGKFAVSPSAPTTAELNKITARHGFPKLSELDFQHAMSTSNKSLNRDMLVTFDVHGAEDQLRLKAQSEFTYFRRLVEVFGVLFGDQLSGFAPATSVNHFFLLNKTSGELRRIPTMAPSTVDLAMSGGLFQAIGRPDFDAFLAKISFSIESMYDRVRNAIKFFSMALNANDRLSSFLFYVISMESIFSRDKNNPIKVTLADMGAMLCFPPAQRLEAHHRIRKAYDLRSAIVHNGASSVPDNDVKLAKLLAARAIYGSLFLCQQLESGQGKLEDRFFNYLRDQKLGLVKAMKPSKLWNLPEIVDIDEE